MLPSRILLVAIAAGLATAAAARDQAGTAPRDPADPGAALAPLVYQSPFSGYRSFADGPVGSWRAVNDEVGRIGGWKVYAREVFEAMESEKRGEPAAGARPAPEAPAGAGPGGK